MEEKKQDGRKNNGGTKGNKGGRPSKAAEQKVNTIFINALKKLHNTESDDDAKVAFVKDLYESQRGQLFIAEHLFGKPKEKVDVTTGGETLNNIISLGAGIKPT